MKTLRNQLLLKITRYLTGHMSRMDIVAWARDEVVSGHAVRTAGSYVTEGRPSDGSSPWPLVREVLSALCLLPPEGCREYAPARANLFYYKERLERSPEGAKGVSGRGAP